MITRQERIHLKKRPEILLIGQANWVRSLADGLQATGLDVSTAPLDSLARAINPRTWMKVAAADVLLRVGFRPGAQTWRGRAFDAAISICGRRSTTGCYWIGTDVQQLVIDAEQGRTVSAWRSPAFSVHHHLAGSAPLLREMEQAGIGGVEIPFPWRTVDPPDTLPPIPSEVRVLTYIPDARAEFYGGPAILEAARRLPTVQFGVMGGTGSWASSPPSNVTFMGWVDDPAAAYASASAVLRIVDHDSVGGTAVEGLMFGRRVIYTQPLDHCVQVSADVDSLVAALAQLVDDHNKGCLVPDESAAQWARHEFDHTRRFSKLAKHLLLMPDLPRQQRLTYQTLQATTQGQAAHAHVHEIIKGLAANGWTVRLLQPRYTSNNPSPMRRIVEFARVQGAAAAGLPFSDAFYIRSHFAALPAAMASKLFKTPSLQEVNGPHDDAVVAWPALRPLGRQVAQLGRLQFRMADDVITVTPQMAAWIKRDSGRDGAKVVPNGADVSRFRPGLPTTLDLPENYVVFFGALSPWQGVEVALEAVTQESWPLEVALVIAGDGHMRQLVEKSVGDRVVYLGRRSYAEIPSIVSNALASLLPKSARDHSESGLSPLKLYESMACGVPIIASDLPSLADTIHAADCGIVVTPGSSSSLAAAVRHLWDFPDVAAEMGQRGRSAAVEEHSWRRRADDTAAILQAVVR